MLEQDIRELSITSGRRIGSQGHDMALEYLHGRMESLGLEYFHGNDYRIPYLSGKWKAGMNLQLTNLAGVIRGTDSGAMPILLGAHYDSAVDGPSSDDNAASIAVLLKAAEILRKKQLRRNVIVTFFDAEEAPCFLTEDMGSIRFYNDLCRGLDFACVVILDMIGHDFQIVMQLLDTFLLRIREMLFVTGSESHSRLPSIIEDAASSVNGLRIIPALDRYIGNTSDNYIFRKEGQPFLFISRGRGRHSHTVHDNIKWINFDAVRKACRFLINLIALIDTTDMENGREHHDPFRFEIRMLRKAIGWPLPVLLGYLGLPMFSLDSREKLDSLAGKLAGCYRF